MLWQPGEARCSPVAARDYGRNFVVKLDYMLLISVNVCECLSALIECYFCLICHVLFIAVRTIAVSVDYI